MESMKNYMREIMKEKTKTSEDEEMEKDFAEVAEELGVTVLEIKVEWLKNDFNTLADSMNNLPCIKGLIEKR